MTAGRGRWRLVRAGTDAVPASVRQFMARARHRPWRMVAARSGALVGTVAVLVTLTGWALWSSPLLGVREVRVAGTKLLTPAEVGQAAAVAEHAPLPRLDLGEIAARVAALPPVERVEVRRDWPDTLVIEIVERTAVAVVPVGDQFHVIDSHGVVFQTVATQLPEVPVVVVPAPGPTDPATQAALVVLRELTPELRTQLRALTVAGPVRISLELHSGRTVVWGDERDSARKAQVATVLLQQDGETIDVSSAEVVSVR